MAWVKLHAKWLYHLYNKNASTENLRDDLVDDATWFRENHMVANPSKKNQSIILSWNGGVSCPLSVQTNDLRPTNKKFPWSYDRRQIEL